MRTGKESSQPQTYVFGDFHLDAAKHLLFKGDGEIVPLMPKAFDILLYLVRHNGKVIEKDELMREIWPDTSVEENNLTQNISILRRIFGEKPGEHRFIVTVPGRGYKFVADVVENAEFSHSSPDWDPRTDVEGSGPDDGLSGRSAEQVKSAVETRSANDIRQSDQRVSTSRFWLLTMLGAIIAALSLLGFCSSVDKEPSPSKRIKTMAVLPFKPLAVEGRNEALELGMAETLISKLSDGEITVRPLSAIRRFSSVDQDSLAAGRELNVEAVLDGTIQTAGDRIRVSARLLRVDDGKQLWMQQFDENLTDIFALQDSISERVADALEITLGNGSSGRYTKSVEAYQLYTKGRLHASRLILPEVQKGIAYYEQAIAVDPSYAMAYVNLANAYRAMVLTNDADPRGIMPKAKAAASKAAQLDSTLAEAQDALATTAFWFDWDWDAAERHSIRALVLDPNSSQAHFGYAHFLSNTGRHEAALAEIMRARELEPVNLVINALEGQILFFAGKDDEALKVLLATSDMDPNFWLAPLFMTRIYLKRDAYDEAVAIAAKASEMTRGNAEAVATMGYALAKAGKAAEARAVLDDLGNRAAERYVPSYALAQIHNGLGDKDTALTLLEKAFDEKDVLMVFLKVEPKWDNLRSQPRFIDLMKRMKLD